MTKKRNYDNWSKEELIREVIKLEKRKKYGVVWEDKLEEVATLCKEKLPILEEEVKKEIKTDSEKPVNILIEGDNYHALSVLNYTHKGKIDVIYIDPPYNTGAKDWKYNNHYVDSNDQWRHSKWLSFMDKRLRLAKKLLKKNGVFICTIDHNEQEALGLLLQEIFPGKNIVCVTIVHNPAGIQGDNFSYCHEYAYFVFSKGGRYIGHQIRNENEADIRNFRDVTGDDSLRTAAANCFYPIYVKNGEIIGFGDVCRNDFHPGKVNIIKNNGVIEVYPVDPQDVERKWRFARQTVKGVKDELKAKYINKRKVWDIVRIKNRFNYKTVWNDSRYSSNNHGTQLLNQIVERNAFSYPKSIYAVIDSIDAASKNNNEAIILDFFAGSGTTGHAILEMNKDDGGKRKFILCTNNENKIAEDICYPRIKNVINGYIGRISSKRIKGLAGNLKYFKTAFVDANPTDKNKKRLVDKSTEMLCLKEDCFDEVKKGEDFRIFKNSQNKYLGIIYDDKGIEGFKKEAKKMKEKFVVYVFSLDESAREEEFEDMADMVQLKPIPAVILNVYKRIFK
ncbi:MAG: DNA methyltransferase [bacterium]|nr:DNA methyltransferase [bacterium]